MASVGKEIMDLMSFEVFVHALISDQINISGDGLSFSGYTGCIIQLLTDSWLHVLTNLLLITITVTIFGGASF